MTKAETRAHFIAQLREAGRSGAPRQQASEAICAAVRQQPQWNGAHLVAAFLPLPAEPQIAPLWEDDRTRAFCFPRLWDRRVELIRIDDPELLRRSNWKLEGAEVSAAPLVDPRDVQLFLVPGLAFAADGARLGRGGGFYDRLLALRSEASTALGLCFHLQLVPALATEPHDQRMDGVITEEGLARA